MISPVNRLEIQDLRSQPLSQSVVSINIALIDLVNKFSFVQEQNLAYLNSLSTQGAQKFFKKFNEDPEIQRRLRSLEMAKTSNAIMPIMSQHKLKKSHSEPITAKSIHHCEESLFKKRRLNSGNELVKLEVASETTSDSDISDILSQFTDNTRESFNTYNPGAQQSPEKSLKITQTQKLMFKSDKGQQSIADKTLEGLGPFKLFKKSTDYQFQRDSCI